MHVGIVVGGGVCVVVDDGVNVTGDADDGVPAGVGCVEGGGVGYVEVVSVDGVVVGTHGDDGAGIVVVVGVVVVGVVVDLISVGVVLLWLLLY